MFNEYVFNIGQILYSLECIIYIIHIAGPIVFIIIVYYLFINIFAMFTRYYVLFAMLS